MKYVYPVLYRYNVSTFRDSIEVTKIAEDFRNEDRYFYDCYQLK